MSGNIVEDAFNWSKSSYHCRIMTNWSLWTLYHGIYHTCFNSKLGNETHVLDKSLSCCKPLNRRGNKNTTCMASRVFMRRIWGNTRIAQSCDEVRRHFKITSTFKIIHHRFSRLSCKYLLFIAHQESNWITEVYTTYW